MGWEVRSSHKLGGEGELDGGQILVTSATGRRRSFLVFPGGVLGGVFVSIRYPCLVGDGERCLDCGGGAKQRGDAR